MFKRYLIIENVNYHNNYCYCSSTYWHAIYYSIHFMYYVFYHIDIVRTEILEKSSIYFDSSAIFLDWSETLHICVYITYVHMPRLESDVVEEGNRLDSICSIMTRTHSAVGWLPFLAAIGERPFFRHFLVLLPATRTTTVNGVLSSRSGDRGGGVGSRVSLRFEKKDWIYR